ncbi:hypothetical protein QNK01_00790 [Desemzia incerta]|uniref:hypothetical protein n=1 Tax=Desemzia incerta TaxID=82801 RepID=UPI0024C26DD6|nr:hypothetical protein [Desemzia incerta]WHZ32211.1 hypothetical protein QNK01_00790 [Desemzia incerta]
MNQHFETREHEDSRVKDYREEYDNEVFWTEFASRMAMRDIKGMQLMEAEEFGPRKSLENI